MRRYFSPMWPVCNKWWKGIRVRAMWYAFRNDTKPSCWSRAVTMGVDSQRCHFSWIFSPKRARPIAWQRKMHMTANRTMCTCSPSSWISSSSPKSDSLISLSASSLNTVNMRRPMKPRSVSSEYSDVRMGWNTSGVDSLSLSWPISKSTDMSRMNEMNATTVVFMAATAARARTRLHGEPTAARSARALARARCSQGCRPPASVFPGKGGDPVIVEALACQSRRSALLLTGSLSRRPILTLGP
mmetsp:Transcript_34311/g.106076  ORF Transcript_34311/g.106076 Transcript_34311/m.106076 type:complete len:243 (-) Transcript_34311:8-736(-)